MRVWLKFISMSRLLAEDLRFDQFGAKSLAISGFSALAEHVQIYTHSD